MRHAQQRFSIDVRTGWVDYSPALRHHAGERIRASLAEFASQIRSVTVRIWNDEPHHPTQRRCEIEVMTTHAGPISGSSAGTELFGLVDRAVDAVVETFGQRTSDRPLRELHRRIA